MFSKTIIYIIKIYQRNVSPLFPAVCRFVPSCSEYTLEAVQRYGALKGVFLGLKRVLKCHPFSRGGYDPVPYLVRQRRNVT